MEINNFTTEENIELFKSKLEEAIKSSNLPSSVIYYVLQDLTRYQENKYRKDRESIVSSINSKLGQL